jgi:hypothetical protein
MASPLPLRRSLAWPRPRRTRKEMAFNMHHFHFQDPAKDAAGLTAGFTPLAFLAPFGGPAVAVSLLNILVFALLRFYTSGRGHESGSSWRASSSNWNRPGVMTIVRGIALELSELKRHFEEDSTTIKLLQFTNAGPREVEVELFYKNVLCSEVVRACAQIESEESVVPKATRYLQACELEICFDDEGVPFTLELFDLSTQEEIVAKVFRPLFSQLHKYDGFTPEEAEVLRRAELYSTLCEAATSSFSSVQPPPGLFEEARAIIQRRRDEHQRQQAGTESAG